jgi:hypothetical protein
MLLEQFVLLSLRERQAMLRRRGQKQSGWFHESLFMGFEIGLAQEQKTKWLDSTRAFF